MDPVVMRSVSRLLHLELHPERCSFEEPEVNVTSNGREKFNKGMRWEKVGRSTL